jgi:hypothetical protein
MDLANSLSLCDRSDEDLLSGLSKLTGSHRELTALIVAHLAEIEQRRLHLLAGFRRCSTFARKSSDSARAKPSVASSPRASHGDFPS